MNEGAAANNRGTVWEILIRLNENQDVGSVGLCCWEPVGELL